VVLNICTADLYVTLIVCLIPVYELQLLSKSGIILPFAVTLFLIIHRTVSFIRLNMEKCPLMIFVNFLTMCEYFCMKVYTAVKQLNVHFISMFGLNILGQ